MQELRVLLAQRWGVRMGVGDMAVERGFVEMSKKSLNVLQCFRGVGHRANYGQWCSLGRTTLVSLEQKGPQETFVRQRDQPYIPTETHNTPDTTPSSLAIYLVRRRNGGVLHWEY